MFTKIAKFFIENWKLTLVLIITVFITWAFSYTVIPKQYNPEIIVPAFEITINANSLSPSEVKRYVTSTIENKIMELEWIDEVYSVSWENYAWVMAKFNVWVDKEKAKIRLTQKLQENIELKPIEVSSFLVKAIDPDELPQITYAISYKNTWNNLELNEEDKYIYLRQIANIVKERIKIVKNVTTIDIVWWYKKDIIIELDNEKLESHNIDILNVYNVIKTNNISSPVWDLYLNSKEKININVNWKIWELKDIENIIVWNTSDKVVYLKDVSNIKYWVKKLDKTSLIVENSDSKPAYLNINESVLIGFWKKIWTNSIFVTDDIKEEIEKLEIELPKNIEIIKIQDEWETAKNATNMLVMNLVQSIIIVVIILTLSLWFKNALNTAISIPLTLFSIFSISLFIWENINRITLFALILVLWMLVDDSTVVVENISRHMQTRKEEWKTKLEAILNAIKEVELWVVLSTVTRLLAFWAMFAVWWMMWEYMWPIPKFALMASVISTIVALTINPWLSFYLINDKKETKKKVKKRKWSIRKYFISFLGLFLWEAKKNKFRRKLFKIIFWVSLFTIILWPIYAWIFKARMLPKSNQDQVYLWIDAPRWYSAEQIKEIEVDISKFFFNKEINQYNIIKNISFTSGQAFIWDFANLFRWGWYRTWENQISSRINLYSVNEYLEINAKDRPSSEKYVIEIRPLFRDFLLNKYPDIKIKLLEDPPWPPVRSTFRAKIKWDAKKEDLYNFALKAEKEIKLIWVKEWIVDIANNLPTTYKKIDYIIDHESISRAWLSTQKVIDSLAIALDWVLISTRKDNDSLEYTNIVLKSKTINNSINSLKEFTITNNNWVKIPLYSFVKEVNSFVWDEIETDNREENYTIAWEMWNNSLVYPQIQLIKKFLNKDFLWTEYKVDSRSLYKIDLIWLKDSKRYTIEWWWEWELTLDTFRDLWTAMIIALIWIYLILVWQFKSFSIARIIMITFLLWFFWVFGIFSFLFLIKWEYFSATSMIWVIALGWIVVWNAILLIEYINILKNNWILLKDALLKATYTRFKPIILTSLTTVFGAATIIWDPVWSWLAWAIIWGLLISSILTLFVIPIFYYDSQKKSWDN